MNRSKGVQERFTSLVKPSSTVKHPLIYTFARGSKTVSEHLNLNGTDLLLLKLNESNDLSYFRGVKARDCEIAA